MYVQGHHGRLTSSRGQILKTLVCQANRCRSGFILQALGKFWREDTIKFRLWKDHSGDEAPEGLVKGGPVTPQSCCNHNKRKFLSCKFWGKTLEGILMNINRGTKHLRGSKLGNASYCTFLSGKTSVRIIYRTRFHFKKMETKPKITPTYVCVHSKYIY